MTGERLWMCVVYLFAARWLLHVPTHWAPEEHPIMILITFALLVAMVIGAVTNIWGAVMRKKAIA